MPVVTCSLSKKKSNMRLIYIGLGAKHRESLALVILFLITCEFVNLLDFQVTLIW